MSNHYHITPYAFFPSKNQLRTAFTPPASNYCELLGFDLEADRTTVNYCECEQCPLMPTVKESICCFDLLKASTKWAKNWTNFIGETDECFSNHKKIIKVITDIEQLDNFIQFDKLRLKEKARYTRSIYIDEYDVAEENDKYRFACYRMITTMVHDSLGIGKRVQLPACIVTSIRNIYPTQTETYKGYEEYFGADN
uniref:Uncharacterized protein n=1 Tax=Panagrolaimus sp. PS1159 TaxID=55785 RepID=A0AC35EQH6_9BILA